MSAPATEVEDPPVRAVQAWTVTTMSVLFIVVNWADKSILGIAAQPLMEDLKLSNSELGFIGSAFYFLFSIVGVITGFIADRVSARWVLLIMVLAWSVTQLPVLVFATGTALLISRIALGAAEGPSTAMASVAAFTWFPQERRALPAALISSGASIAKIAIAPVLALIVVGWGWRAAFVVLAGLGLVWAAVWVLVGREGPYARSTTSAAAANDDVPFLRIVSRPTFIGAVLGTFAMYALVSVVLTWLPSYLEKGLGFPRLAAGSMLGLPSVVAMAAMVGVSWFTDRRLSAGGSSRTLRGLVAAGSLVVGGLLLAALPAAKGVTLAIALVCVGYGIAATSLPLLAACVSRIAPAGRQGSVLGLYFALQATSGLIAPALTGILVDAADTPAQGYALAFQVFGVVAAIGGVSVALLVHPDRDVART